MLESPKRLPDAPGAFRAQPANNQANAVGIGNQIIQIIGAHGLNRPMPIFPIGFVEAPQSGGGEAVALEWRTRLAAFTGRDAELKALQDWLAEPHSLSFKIIHAEAGVGKTRLAAEFAELPKVAPNWVAGWVDLQHLEASDRLQWDEQCLLLVDYPEHNPQRIGALARAALAGMDDNSPKLRVLLLCREEPALMGALQGARVGAYLSSSVALQPLGPEDNFEAFASAINRHGPAMTPAAGQRSTFDQWLVRDPMHRTALFVNALARDLMAVARKPDGSDWLTGVGLLKALVKRERVRWTLAEEGAHAPTGSVSNVMFWATLLGGIGTQNVNGVLAESFEWQRSQWAPVHKALAAVRPDAGKGIRAFEPDLLAVVFLTEWLLAPENQLDASHCAKDFFSLLPEASFSRALGRINMLAYDQAFRLGLVKPAETGALDLWMTQLCAASAALHEVCCRTLPEIRAWQGLPSLTHQLATVTASSALLGVMDIGDLPIQLQRALDLMNASINLSQVGDLDIALVSARAAVEIGRRLVVADPATYESDLAALLNNLANRLGDFGDRAGALVSAREVVVIRRGLFLRNPATYERDLAMSLNNLAGRLNDVGDRAGALTTAREVAAFYRKLAQTSPAAYEADLAASLNNLAAFMRSTGDIEGAIVPAWEAVEIRRRLALSNPAAFEPELAMSLSNLAGFMSKTNHRAAALVPAREAVEIRRRLAHGNPAAYEAGLAGSLNNLAVCLSATGDWAGALVPAHEAVEIRRRLAESNPAAHEADFAACLTNLANRLAETGDLAGALEHAHGAVDIRRRLAKGNPEAHDPDLAMSLSILAALRSRTGDRAGALAPAREAVDLNRRLVMSNPATYEPELAGSLNNLANCFSMADDVSGALPVAREAVEVYRRLAQANPAAYEPELAGSLNNLANVLIETGDRLGAMVSAREVVEICRKLAQANPSANEPGLAMSLGTLMHASAGSGDLAGALAAGQESMALFTRLAQRFPVVFGPYRDQTGTILCSLERHLDSPHR